MVAIRAKADGKISSYSDRPPDVYYIKATSYGLLTKLAKTFGVTRECIVQIDRRRIWRSINRPKPKQQFFIEGDPK
jgi:hypothetical protein